jgi:CubicO group peptidase (beta-lactamase class C family)
METGLDYDNDIHTGEMIYCKGSSLEYILSRPMVFEPGTDWYYGDGNPQIMSGIITRASGKTMRELADEFLFEPMGIKQYLWENHSDGLTFGGMGLWLKPRDMAKIGKLMLNGGNWEGRQLISNEWVSASTVRQANHRELANRR